MMTVCSVVLRKSAFDKAFTPASPIMLPLENPHLNKSKLYNHQIEKQKIFKLIFEKPSVSFEEDAIYSTHKIE